METVKRLFISLLVLLGCSAGAWAIEQDSDGFYLIGSVQDWKDFAAVVATTNDAKAKMIADIDLGDDQTHIGSMAQNGTTYKGTFDGQGYTLTVAYVGGSRQIVAPFTNVQGATIKNLHVDGSISSVFAFIGVVGYVRGSGSVTTVSNVWNSATMSIQTGEWAQSGAIVGGFNNGSVVITDCLFTGSFTTNQGGYCGCFTGYTYSAGSITQTNCLSTGTFNMSGTGFRGNHSNCYVSSFPASFPSGVEEATTTGLSDGTIAEALGDAWVQDAETNQPMLKIFTTLRQDEDGYYLIGSVTDWRRFAAIVKTTSTANAKMIRDVDLGDDQTKIGDDIAYTNPSTPNASNPYKGTFDGQGHTLTVNYTTETGKFPSPFPNIEGATIKNLHVAGSIVSTTAHAGGVVSASWGTDVIENVWVSATISSTGQSWDECGAIVACMKKGTLTLKDCIFTGSMTSTRSYNGCFVGYCNAGTTAIDNCLSTGTFSYGGANITYGNITHTNCYVKQFPASIPATMQVTDEQIADGTTTIALQAGRAEEIWVQDPELGIPMLKIFATPAVEYFLIGSLQDWEDFAELVETEPATNGKLIADVDLGDDQTMVGSMESPYRGIFDGQGYKLTVNYDMNLTTSAVAPFAVVGDAVIQKLHVDGSIKQQYCAAGGVVGSITGNVTIKECWVSAYMYVQGYGNLQGTIGGIASCCDNSAARNCSILIEDCVFSGEMATGYHCGSIMSHVNGYNGNSAVIRNCLAIGTYVSPSGSTGTFTRVGTQGDPYTIDNCYYKTPWGAVQGTQATETQLSDGTTAAALGDAWAQDPGTSNPLPKVFTTLRQDKDGYYLIGSVTDWNRFAAIVETTPNANAKMTADVDLGGDQTMIGSGSINASDGAGNVVFKGTFDGQGHTLTVNYNNSETFVAPFRFIFGATIKNIHVKGSVTGSGKWLGGIVASVVGRNIYSYLEKCYSSVSVTSTNSPSDNTEHIGGIVSQHAWESKLSLTDCIFDGTLKRKSANKTMSGLVGCSDGVLDINNCISLGTLIDESDSPNRVATFAYPWIHGSLNAVNSYYYNAFGTLQGTQATDDDISDGTTATALQAGRTDEIWVQDPELCIPMLKIFANEETEQPSEALNGVFTINASGEKVSFAKGNLQKIGSTYQFAEHQYDYFGTDQSDTHRDMYAFLDYSNPDNGESWSMLSWEEWKYLFATRSVTNTLSDGARYTMATLGGTYKGLIIFPDYYTHPEGTDFTPGVFDSNSNYTAQVSLEGWAMMEAAGCVFLPAAGWCSAGIDWYGVGEEVGYMSSTPTGSKYYSPYFTPEGVYLDETSRQITWTSIRLVMRLQPLTYTVPASGVGTFSSEVNIHLPEGLNAHYCKTYYAERSAISVNTGVLLSGTPGETFNLYPTPETADDLEGNALVAVTKPVHISPTKGDYTNFMMKGGKFIKIADESYTVKMPANRAYLPLLTEAISGSNAKEIMLYWDDEEATGIERMRNVENEIMRNGSIYNLNGQKLSAPQKGINIINGRKVIVK